MLVLYPLTLLKWHIISRSFLQIYCGFLHSQLCHWKIGIVLFLHFQYVWHLPPCTVLTKSDENGRSCLVHDVRGSVHSITVTSIYVTVSLYLSVDVLYQLSFHLFLNYWECFHKWVLDFIKYVFDTSLILLWSPSRHCMISSLKC